MKDLVDIFEESTLTRDEEHDTRDYSEYEIEEYSLPVGQTILDEFYEEEEF